MLDLHSEILVKLAFYAHYNDISSDIWKYGPVTNIKINGQTKQISVMDILGNLNGNYKEHQLLKRFIDGNNIGDKITTILSNKSLPELPSDITSILEDKPRSLFGRVKLNNHDSEIWQHIWTETATVARLTNSQIGFNPNLHVKTPSSMVISRLLKDETGKPLITLSSLMGVQGSDKMYIRKKHSRIPETIYYFGEIEKKYISSSKLGRWGLRQRLSRVQVYSFNDSLLMGRVISRDGDYLASGDRMKLPQRYHSYNGFGASSVDRIGRDWHNHFRSFNQDQMIDSRFLQSAYQARLEQAIIYEAIYSGRSFKLHSDLNREIDIEEIPNTMTTLEDWNYNLRKEWAKLTGNPIHDAPPNMIFVEADDKKSDKTIKLDLYTGSRLEIGKDIRKNAVITVSILPSDFWIPNDQGHLGLRSQPGIDVSYYTISPENYSNWIHQLPSDIHGKKGDKSTIERVKWYKAKVKELTSKKGQWARLLQARK